MKKILLTILLSALVLPVMANTSKDLEKILENKKLAKEINSSLKNIKEQTELISCSQKANNALDILIKENNDLKPLITRVQYTHNGLVSFLNNTEYKSEEDFRQTCKDLFYYLDAIALDILEIGKVNKDLANTIEKIVDHQYFLKALNIEANISALLTMTTKYYKPAFYDNMAIAESNLIKQGNKTGFNKDWEDFINSWLEKNNK